MAGETIFDKLRVRLRLLAPYPRTDEEAATKKYVDDHTMIITAAQNQYSVGDGHDRNVGTVYQNTSGKTRFLTLYVCADTYSGSGSAAVGGVASSSSGNLDIITETSMAGVYVENHRVVVHGTVALVIPPDYYYKMRTYLGAGNSLTYGIWSETDIG
jgi:hypothetical protein